MDMFNDICGVWDSPTTTGVEGEKRTRNSLLDYCPAPDWQYRNDYLHPEYHRFQWTDSSGLRGDSSRLDSNSDSKVEGAQ